jgi:hypothetical protein
MSKARSLKQPQPRNEPAQFSWLMRGEIDNSNPRDSEAPFLEFEAYLNPHNKKRGKPMTQSIGNARYPACARARRMQDVLLVSSFGLWAAILGLSPVLAFRLLMN